MHMETLSTSNYLLQQLCSSSDQYAFNCEVFGEQRSPRTAFTLFDCEVVPRSGRDATRTLGFTVLRRDPHAEEQNDLCSKNFPVVVNE